jgi:hypothetical protein
MSVSTHVRWILTTSTPQQFVLSFLTAFHRHSDGLVFTSAIAVIAAENMYWTCKLRVRVCVLFTGRVRPRSASPDARHNSSRKIRSGNVQHPQYEHGINASLDGEERAAMSAKKVDGDRVALLTFFLSCVGKKGSGKQQLSGWQNSPGLQGNLGMSRPHVGCRKRRNANTNAPG